ncbi:Putative inner membrane protein [Salmonella enterica subsp. enterica]|uniref:Inner membrane protein n=1 Tax=Salmonella enterica I TaxID=59201 RepID=A0A3S4HWU4_SALET|nr:Putative inner membrane protein [Salmonella enterica subsp. enterica]
MKATRHLTSPLGWVSSLTLGRRLWRPDRSPQDVDHRIIPNWGAAALMIKNRNVGETLHDPKKMAIACAVIGMIVVTFLNLTASSVPEALQVTAVKVLVPAANLLVNIVMPVIFWLAAIDAGKKSGFWATVFGGAAQLIMGNAVPGAGAGYFDRQRRRRERLEPCHQSDDGRHRFAVCVERILPRLRHENDRVFQHDGTELA